MWNLKDDTGNSPVVQWLGLYTSTAGGLGSIPGQVTRIPQATPHAPPPQMRQMNLSTKQKQTHEHREQTCGCQGGEGRGNVIYYICNG